MSQRQIGINKKSSISIVAVFGLLTMSSSVVSNSCANLNINKDYLSNENNLCNSSILSKQVIGDIVSANEEKADYEVKHEKINVTLNIEKVTKHVSHFEFEEEYEEI